MKNNEATFDRKSMKSRVRLEFKSEMILFNSSYMIEG